MEGVDMWLVCKDISYASCSRDTSISSKIRIFGIFESRPFGFVKKDKKLPLKM